jgi:MFS family permease
MIVTAEGSEESASLGVPRLNARLSILVFLASAIMGAWVPVFSLHLKKLQFSAEATAWASAANALGAVLAPLVWGQIADRWLAIERCISLCAIVTGIALWIMADLNEPWPLIPLCIAMWFFLVPVMGLTSAFIFRLLEHPERDFGRVRMFGTVGWAAASWCLTLWYWLTHAASIADYSDSLRLGGLIAFVLAAYAWTLPHTPPRALASVAFPERAPLTRLFDAPLAALQLFRYRSYVVYCVCMFGMNVTLPFTIQLNPLLLENLRVPAPVMSMCLTIAQSTEVAFLFLLPYLLTRFGLKSVMVLGGVSWALGLSLLSVGEPVGLVLASLMTHGIFICCFFIAGQVFVNRLATHDFRASAQGVLLLISGSGLLLGHLLVGWARDYARDNYRFAYASAAMIAAGMVLLLWLGFEGVPNSIHAKVSLADNGDVG